MSEQYQRVEPTPFDAPAAQSETPAAKSASAARPAWLVPAIAGLALAAIVVVFFLPQWIEPKAIEPRSTPAASSSTGEQPAGDSAAARSTETAPGISPFADALEAKARKEAQDLLAELLDVQESLIERGAESWASEEMAAIAQRALEGDEQYRNREFDAAIENYKVALDSALALEGSLPERFAEQLAVAELAIESLEIEDARTALETAELLDPGAPELIGLAARVNALPGVIDSVAAATAAEESGALEEAVDSMGEAATLDPGHRYVAAELGRLKNALNDQRFNAAMSEGYAALDSGEFDRARQRFERAGKLSPGSSEVGVALQELSVARTAARLRSLQDRGEKLLAEEDWKGAAEAFREALKIDAGLRFARDGLAVAEPRAALQAQLTTIEDNPERLVDDAVLREARAVLATSENLDNIGPKLGAQIARVSEILQVASTPVPALLRSDGETSITVYKVARLGSFQEQELSLRPGKYTAVGTRRGYRDVRVVFEVKPAGTDPVYIACSEMI